MLHVIALAYGRSGFQAHRNFRNQAPAGLLSTLWPPMQAFSTCSYEEIEHASSNHSTCLITHALKYERSRKSSGWSIAETRQLNPNSKNIFTGDFLGGPTYSSSVSSRFNTCESSDWQFEIHFTSYCAYAQCIPTCITALEYRGITLSWERDA